MDDIVGGDRTELARLYALKWKWCMDVVGNALERHTGPKLRVRYEDLLADTPNELRRILAWLDLDVSNEAIDAIAERHAFRNLPDESTGPKAFNRAASPGLWRRNLSAEEQAAVAAVVEETLVSLGYDL